MSLTVIKLGGSLYDTAELTKWLAKLEKMSLKHAIVIVPGGGPFADQVRLAQQTCHFDEETAHHMALLAMAQYGLMLTGLCRVLHPLYYPVADDKLLPGLYIWLPDRELMSVTELPQSWDVTSDSLALWFSQQINADELHIIKRVNATNHCLNNLVVEGVLDKAFEEIYRSKPIPTKLYYYQDMSLYPDAGITLR